jgi:hypothetical protein
MAGIEDLTPLQLKHLRYGEMVLEAKDPEIVEAAKRLARKVDKTLHLPEIDLQDKIEAEAKKREEWEAKQEEHRRDEHLRRRRAEEAQRSRDAGFDPEEIEKIVIDEKCSFDTALRIAGLQRETAVPGAAPFAGLPLNATQDGEYDWRKHSASENRRKGLEIANQGIADMLRRARGR